MKYIHSITPFFSDSRGEMSRILNNVENIVSILLITSRKGSIRANHYHKKDIHYMYLLTGKMEYSYKEVRKSNSRIKKLIVKPNELIKTPAMTSHATRFLEDSTFLAFSIRPRDFKSYENDTIRVKLI